MKIEYLEKNGKLYFECCEEIPSGQRSYRMYEYSEEVPSDIVAKGAEAVKEYAEEKVRKDFAKKKAEWDARDRYEANTNFPVSVSYKGAMLKGKITSAVDGDLRVQLESPYIGLSGIHYGFASAMSGKYIFGDNGNFTENAIVSAKELLIGIYKEQKHRQKHKKIIGLAEELNKDKISGG